MSRASRAAIVLAVIVALLCTISAVSFAAKSKARNRMAKPAALGAGKRPSGSASSTSNVAWIYTGNFRDTNPEQIAGSIKLTASKGATITEDKALVNATFNYQGAKYAIQLECPFPIVGQDFPGRGPVQFMRRALGSTDLGTLNLPETHAHIAIYARSTIRRDGKIIVDSQPTVVLVNKAIHDTDQSYLATPSDDRTEISLIVPGPFNGQKFLKTFANGAFYVYWPNVKYSVSSNVTPTPMPTQIPTRAGRGPATPTIGTTAPRGSIDVSLTNSGIVKQVGQIDSGLYDLNITNNSSRPRGLRISGIDLCCTPYTRFSHLLQPGESQVFRWFFAPGKVQFRDFLSGRKSGTGYKNVKLGGHSSSIAFQ